MHASGTNASRIRLERWLNRLPYLRTEREEEEEEGEEEAVIVAVFDSLANDVPLHSSTTITISLDTFSPAAFSMADWRGSVPSIQVDQ